MDFIERIFGVSPDGGNGALEACLILIPVITIAVGCWRYLLHRQGLKVSGPR
jgi:hypothetical protein